MSKVKKHIVAKIILFLSIFSMIFTTAFADDNILNQVKQLIKDYYIEPVKDEVYNAASIDDVLKSINDPYSDYFTREEFNDYLDKMGYGFSGIGISIEVVPEGVKIISVSQESSAQKTGLIPGDLIVWANGYYLSGLSIDKIMSYIKGRTGSKVVIIVKRDGKYYAYSIVRKESAVPSVEGGMINHTAYIRIYSFNESTADEFNDMLVNLNRNNPSNYIIDLRYNPGGYLNSTLDIAGYFIGNSTVVIGKNKKNAATVYKGYQHNIKINKPVMFLVNEYSASAAEILTCAVKDYKKAVIIGNTTFGKGLVQTMFSLTDGSVLKLTVLKYFSPLGHAINKIGVKPDLYSDDPMVEAQLLSGYSGTGINKTGFIKVVINGMNFVINGNLLSQDKYKDAYEHIMNKAASSNYQVYAGYSRGWIKISPYYAEDDYLVYHKNYTEMPALINVPVNQKFTVTFPMDINKSTINDSSIELIYCQYGCGMALKFQFVNKRTIRVIPYENLDRKGEYFLLVHKTVRGVNGQQIKNGLLYCIKVK